MIVSVYTLNAFSKTHEGGNPAGVALKADTLSESQMLQIANKIGFSETAFVLKSEKADFKVRFFTPNREVDLCGYATIASFSLMANLNLIEEAKYTQETKAGILKIEVQQDKKIFMNQNNPQFFDELNKEEISDFDKVYEISKKNNVIGYHLFTFETKFNSTAHCRNFALLYNIQEESATGTSNGALSCYLWKNHKIHTQQINNLVYEQGY